MKLPIADYKGKILSSVNGNPVTIITAETGSGKSTQVCQYLQEDGYDVIITQPKRIAAVSLASRVSDEIGNSDLVGYHIGLDNSTSPSNKIIFCSDGIQLVKQLTALKRKKDQIRSKQVLIIDEVHEWNLNIETLIAWCKKMMKTEDWCTKVVIMSATLNHEDLSKYYYDAPVLDIPGAVYPVETIERTDYEFIQSIKEFYHKGKNILVFVPGKKEIDDTIKELDEIDAEILPLHGELSLAEQKMCFGSYDHPKIIIATNVAQTSITVPDIDVVIDRGTERRIETKAGIQGLLLKDISIADCIQRKGRAGRTKPGIYVLCGTPMKYRPEYPIPEIQRLILDQMVLRLIDTGIDATELDFFHQPNIESVIAAKKTLERIGAINDNGITDIGKKILQIPTSVKYARMIIEADKLGVVDDVVTIASIFEVGSLLNHKETCYYNFTNEETSDLLAELDVWKKLQGRKVNFKEEGIFSKNFFRIKELRETIMQYIEIHNTVSTGSTGIREDILQACMMGMIDNIYYRNFDYYTDGVTTTEFQLDRKSCVNEYRVKWVTGVPMRIEFETRWGGTSSLDILKSISQITQEFVMEHFPEMFTTKVVDLSYDPYEDCVTGEEFTKFGNVTIKSKTIDIPNHPEYESLKFKYEEDKRKREEERKLYQSYSYSYSSYRAPVEEPKQRTITIEGIKFDVIHPYSYIWSKSNPYIQLTIEDLMNIKETKSAKLDDGSELEFCCRDGSKSQNIQLLKNNIINVSNRKTWNDFVNGIPAVRTKKCKMVLNTLIQYVGKHEIPNIFGDVSIAYVCLDSGDGKIGLRVKKDEDEANELTSDSLKFLIDLILLDKYPSKKFEFKINGKSVLTDKGNRVKTKFIDFVNDCKNELSVDNINEYLDMIDEYYNEVITDLNK